MDPAADKRFRDIYEAYQRQVLAYFLRRTDAATARDGAAETFLVAWRRIDRVPDHEGALPWLFAVARRVLANQRRGRDRYAALNRKLSEAPSPTPPSPEAVMMRRAEDEQVLAAVARLRPMDREIVRLAVWEELPHAQIAEVVGTSPHAITQRLHRINRTLAKNLDQQTIANANGAGRDR
ncbi:MAG: sigma-70 family RNA polymerase sigma factor [Acidimicrobiia bacterium]|nr:sigma-70 family RNA polymerase sigma factor [Acidimicrobiia bacterium]